MALVQETPPLLIAFMGIPLMKRILAFQHAAIGDVELVIENGCGRNEPCYELLVIEVGELLSLRLKVNNVVVPSGFLTVTVVPETPLSNMNCVSM